MKRILFALLCVNLLCTCGPAEDTQGSATEADGVLAAERVFNGAYENLDAAVLDRMLADEYTVTYAGQDTRKDKAAWLGELGQLRVVFPQLSIQTDSLRVTPYAELLIVQGRRTFSWDETGGGGTYRERFTNRWQHGGDGWQLTATQLQRLR